ncbi:MAG: hypothetical protein IKQ41_04680 [Clostridia bacterium]|nr:hypothetical protein [Clostridia bacterium]
MLKKRWVMIALAATLVAVLVGGFVLYTVLNSPQYTLKKIADEVKANGVKAVEPHLTGNALKAYNKVYDISQNFVVQLVTSLTDIHKVVDLLDGKSGPWEYKLGDTKTSGSNSSVTIHIIGSSFSGDLNLEMKKESGSWKISDVAIPIASWIFP